MVKYMSKTKKELIELMQTLEQDIVAITEKNQTLSKELESHQNQGAGFQEENRILKDKIQELETQTRLVTTQLTEIKKRISENKKALEVEKINSSIFENLFISFAEVNDNKILLLDQNSLILYASQAVLRLLNVVNRDKLIGHSFLDMFNSWDSVKVRKKISDVCLKADKKKIKDVNFVTNEMLQMKLKFYPVQYMEQPAVKVVIKEYAD